MLVAMLALGTTVQAQHWKHSYIGVGLELGASGGFLSSGFIEGNMGISIGDFISLGIIGAQNNGHVAGGFYAAGYLPLWSGMLSPGFRGKLLFGNAFRYEELKFSIPWLPPAKCYFSTTCLASLPYWGFKYAVTTAPNQYTKWLGAFAGKTYSFPLSPCSSLSVWGEFQLLLVQTACCPDGFMIGFEFGISFRTF